MLGEMYRGVLLLPAVRAFSCKCLITALGASVFPFLSRRKRRQPKVPLQTGFSKLRWDVLRCTGDGVGNACVVWSFPWDAACLGFFAAPGISVQQVEICALLVTCESTAKALRDVGAV